jgi:hypothetical protein
MGHAHISNPLVMNPGYAVLVSCDEVHPFLVATSLTRSNTIWLCSRFSGWNIARERLKAVNTYVSIETGITNQMISINLHA